MVCVKMMKHGRSKRSGWSGFGRTSFYSHFGTAHVQIMKFSYLQRPITHPRITTWLQQLAISPILWHKMIHPWSDQLPGACYGPVMCVYMRPSGPLTFSPYSPRLSTMSIWKITLSASRICWLKMTNWLE